MNRGRRPKPTALRLIEGNPGKRAFPRNEPSAGVRLPQPPKHLDPIAREFWRSTGAQLVKIRVMTEADAKALELAAIAYANFRRAQSVLQEKGFTYEAELLDRRGNPCGTITRQRPEVVIAKNAWRQSMMALVEFGLTPSSRTRVSVSGDVAPTDAADAIQRDALR